MLRKFFFAEFPSSGSPNILQYSSLNKNILSKHFGPNSEGHGHVIGTSSCIKGVLAGLMTRIRIFSGTILTGKVSRQKMRKGRSATATISLTWTGAYFVVSLNGTVKKKGRVTGLFYGVLS